MAGKILLLAGVLALACVASASVQSTQLDHEGKCGKPLMHASDAAS